MGGAVRVIGPVDDGTAQPLHVIVDSMPAGGAGLTDGELRASPVPVTLAGAATAAEQASQTSALGAPADAEATGNGSIIGLLKRLRTLLSSPLAVTGTFWQATQPVSGSVSIAGTAAVSGPLTDAQLRAAAVPVSVSAGAAMTFVSLKSAAPAANAVQADTGQLAAGDYDFDINLACADTVAVGKGLVVEHRNAANNANINVLGGCTPNGGAIHIQVRKITLAVNERIRVIAGTAAGAASSMYVSAIGRRAA